MWTEERKAKMRLQIQHWKPWEKSTGPKTQAGKAVSSRNSLKHGAFAAQNRRQVAVFKKVLAVASDCLS